MARYNLEQTSMQAVALCAFEKRSDGQWAFEAIGKACGGRTAKSGETVDVARGRPHAPIKDLQRGESVFLSPTLYDDDDDRLHILDEWGCRDGWIWLDATVLVFDKNGKKIGEVDFNDRSWEGGVIRHSGDRKDESGKHGSHEISIQMKRLTESHRSAFSLLLVISAYSGDLTDAVKPFVSLSDADRVEIARFSPDTNYRATSIQMVDIHRHGDGWVLSAHGVLGDGKANEYGPIIERYQDIHKCILASGGMKTFAPTFDHSNATSDYARGPPVE